jgi:hypothetical protein
MGLEDAVTTATTYTPELLWSPREYGTKDMR